MPLIHTHALLALAAHNFESLVQFYRQLLNQEPVVYRANVYAEFQLAGMRLGIFRPKVARDELAGGRTHSAMSLCLEVESLEAAVAHLTTLGYPPRGVILTASHGREIYANDPEGNSLILHQGHASNPT